MRNSISEHVPPEGGWGWVVCIASFWTNGTVFGILNSFGVLLVAMLDDPSLHESGATTFTIAWVGSVAIGITFLMSPVASILTDILGCRKTAVIGGIIAFIGCILDTFVKRLDVLFLTYGILLGIGFSLAYIPSLVILGHYFKKRIGFANGLVTAGSGVFTMIFPLLLELLVETVGLWNTMRAISGFVFLLIPFALTFRPLIPAGVNQGPSSRIKDQTACQHRVTKYLNVQIWKRKNYVIWSIAVPIAMLGYFVPFVHLINHERHVSPGVNGAILISCLSGTSLVGRLVFGRLADLKKFNPVVLQQISFFGIGFITILLPAATSHFGMVILMVLLMGIFDGCFVCMMGPVAFNLVGAINGSQALGFVFGLMAVPGTIGPPVAGYIYDVIGSYNLAFVIAGAAPLMAACVMFLIFPKQTDVKSSNGQISRSDDPGHCEEIETHQMLDHNSNDESNMTKLQKQNEEYT
ncbi:monocarboxylate transporter 10-like [Glandiceps talaboti]